MRGIAHLDVGGFRERIKRFDQSYVEDWNSWLSVDRDRPNEVAKEFGRILRRWQACRPNTMRRSRLEANHPKPYLEDLIRLASAHIQTLWHVELRAREAFNQQAGYALRELWAIFTHLSYKGIARNGLSGVVGISKAVLLLTDGRVGPAFDSNVRGKLGINEIEDPGEWIDALRAVAMDIASFEYRNGCSLAEAAPRAFAHLHLGRLYDMALGPRA